MKLLRFGPAGFERPGSLDGEGRVRDLCARPKDIDPESLSPSALVRLAALDHRSLPSIDGDPRLGVPLTGVGKFIAIGLNYADRAGESNPPIPAEPVIFTKAVTSLAGADDPLMPPRGSVKSDREVELGVVIGSRASYVDEAGALDDVAGHGTVDDIGEREYQAERGGSWDQGEGCDTFGPVGPWLVTRDDVPNPQALGLRLDLNGRRMQTGGTAAMTFGVAEIVSSVSRFTTLVPGHVITTGTPPGVGLGQKPVPVYLKPGDVMTLGIDGLGERRQVVVPWHTEAGSRA